LSFLAVFFFVYDGLWVVFFALIVTGNLWSVTLPDIEYNWKSAINDRLNLLGSPGGIVAYTGRIFFLGIRYLPASALQ